MAKLKLILPVLCLAIGAGAGVGAGLFLAPGSHEEGQGGDSAEADPIEEAPPELEPGQRPEFADFSNQFIVPIVRDGAVRSLVLLSVTLEVAPGGTEEVYSKEPRLRDAFLQVMFDHANLGGFDAAFTQAERMSTLRQGLREVARKLLGTTLRDVLIVDILRQEV